MKFEVQPANPDGLDEVFQAYQTIRLVLTHAVLVPNPKGPDDEEAARAGVEEALNMLEWWLVEESKQRGGLE